MGLHDSFEEQESRPSKNHRSWGFPLDRHPWVPPSFGNRRHLSAQNSFYTMAKKFQGRSEDLPALRGFISWNIKAAGWLCGIMITSWPSCICTKESTTPHDYLLNFPWPFCYSLLSFMHMNITEEGNDDVGREWRNKLFFFVDFEVWIWGTRLRLYDCSDSDVDLGYQKVRMRRVGKKGGRESSRQIVKPWRQIQERVKNNKKLVSVETKNRCESKGESKRRKSKRIRSSTQPEAIPSSLLISLA